MSEKECRVALHNAPGCADWHENVWAIDLGAQDGKRIVSLRNMPIGATFDPPIGPAWGDEIVVEERDGRYWFDLQTGVIVKRHEAAT